MSSPKRYKCKWCDFRGIKMDLIKHIEDEHEDIIPQGYTPARLTFNIINKKEHGKCMVCGRPTEWNEDKYRYETFHSDKCREYYKKEIIDKRMINKYGTTTLLNDEEQQKKMLANRKISGTYKFSNGEEKTYTGSYELKLLEFMDNIMHINPKDIMTPGPTFQYEYDNKKHFWVTDVYYIPFNLLFDVKDGGANKNTNPALVEYREKQDAKEEMISNLGTYNYIRLTDNDFSQLLLIMNQIKFNLIDNDKAAVIHINENVHSIPDNKIYLIEYSNNKYTSEGYAICTNETLDNSFVYNPETELLEKVNFDFFKNKYYTIYEYNNNQKGIITNIKDTYENNRTISFDYMYSELTGHHMTSQNQIQNDDRFENIYYSSEEDESDVIGRFAESCNTSIQSAMNTILSESFITFPLMDKTLIKYKNILLENYPSVDIQEDPDGYFLYNAESCMRSQSYKNIYDIQLENVKFMIDIKL